MNHVTSQEEIVGNVGALKGRLRVSDSTLAEAAGISRSAFNDRMNLRAKFQIDELQRLAVAYEVPLEQLLAPAPAAAAEGVSV